MKNLNLELLLFLLIIFSVKLDTPLETYTYTEEFTLPNNIHFIGTKGSVVTYNECIYITYCIMVSTTVYTTISKKCENENVEYGPNVFVTHDDGHRSPSIGFDKNGYIHLVGDLHNTPWKYYISDSPEDISSFREIDPTSSEMIPGVESSYPFLTSDFEENLYVTFRSKVKDDWTNGCYAASMARYDVENKKWIELGGMNYERFNDRNIKCIYWDVRGVPPGINCGTYPSCNTGAYTGYNPLIFFAIDNRMHLVITIERGNDHGDNGFCSCGGHHTDIMYAYSDDLGDNFHMANGTVYSSLPIRLSNTDIVAGPDFVKDKDGFQHVSMVGVTEDDNPVVSMRTGVSTSLGNNYVSIYDRDQRKWGTPINYPSNWRSPTLIDSWGYITGLGMNGDGICRSTDNGKTWREYPSIKANPGYSETIIDYQYYYKTGHLRYAMIYNMIITVATVKFNGTKTPRTKSNDNNGQIKDLLVIISVVFASVIAFLFLILAASIILFIVKKKKKSTYFEVGSTTDINPVSNSEIEEEMKSNVLD